MTILRKLCIVVNHEHCVENSTTQYHKYRVAGVESLGEDRCFIIINDAKELRWIDVSYCHVYLEEELK